MGCVISNSKTIQITKSLNTMKQKASSFEFNFKREEKLRIKDYQIFTIREVNPLEEFSIDQNLT